MSGAIRRALQEMLDDINNGMNPDNARLIYLDALVNGCNCDIGEAYKLMDSAIENMAVSQSS